MVTGTGEGDGDGEGDGEFGAVVVTGAGDCIGEGVMAGVAAGEGDGEGIWTTGALGRHCQ